MKNIISYILFLSCLSTSSCTTDNLTDEQTIEQQTRLIILLIAINIMVVRLLIWFYTRKIRNKNREIRRHTFRIEKLESSLFETENTTDALQTSIRTLIGERFATLDFLSTTYYEVKGSKSERSRLYERVISLISDMQDSSSNLIRSMESLADLHLNNLMSDFKNDFPQMLPEHQRIFLFTVLNFSSQAICVFTDSDSRKLYNRRYNIKKQILNSTSCRKDEYLHFFRTH